MRYRLTASAVLFAALTMTTSALADDKDKRELALTGITEQRALAIARGYGMVELVEIERDDDGWEIEGRDRRGRDLEVDINREGRVTRVERGDDD